MPLPPNERKAELVRRGISQSDIARKLDVTLSHVSSVIADKRRSPRVEAAIAEAIERPVDEVFAPVDAATAAL